MTASLKFGLITLFLTAVVGVEVFNELREGDDNGAVCFAPSSRADFLAELFRHQLASH